MKKNIEKSQDKQRKKIIKSFIEENYQKGIWQRYCMDGMIRDLIRNIGGDWKKIENIRRESNKKKEKH